jgi:hypothetical protein
MEQFDESSRFDKTQRDESCGKKKGSRFEVAANPRSGPGLAWLCEGHAACANC